MILLSDCDGFGNLVELYVMYVYVDELFCGYGVKFWLVE